ncbi:MAG TPA: peptide chain release factor-like protein, partial [bacterium]|nr:peptide chain release factor-like protein [bacterium]
VVHCQDEKSQHKNRAKALRILRARLFEAEEERKHAERAQARKSQIGTGERAEKIRTYNFPQNRATDHRVNLTLYKLDAVMKGEIEEFIDALRLQAQQTALTSEKA